MVKIFNTYKSIYLFSIDYGMDYYALLCRKILMIVVSSKYGWIIWNIYDKILCYLYIKIYILNIDDNLNKVI